MPHRKTKPLHKECTRNCGISLSTYPLAQLIDVSSPHGNREQLKLTALMEMLYALLCFAFRFVNSLVYYGLSLNVGSFGLDIYLTQLVFGAVEIPARSLCLLLLQWFGRKKSQSFFLLLGGVMCLIITGIPKGMQQLLQVQPNLPGAWSSRV